MIDFHTHILPQMDDGSCSISESIAMLAAAAEQGITDTILSPHYYADENSPSEFLEHRSHSWETLAPHLTDDLPRVHLGAEVQYFEGICAVKDIDCLRIEGTDHLLLEMPFCRWSDRMIDDVLDLDDRPDIRIVLAHIERYIDMQPADLWNELRECGILMQSNVSFFGNWRTRYRAMRMVSKAEINFLGSDCHNMKTRRPNWDKLPGKVREQICASDAYMEFVRQLASK